MISQEKKMEIKGVLRQVNVAEICRKEQVRPATVYEVLSGRSRKMDDLRRVVRAARRQIAQREREAQAI